MERLEDTKNNLRLRLPTQNSKSMILKTNVFRNFNNFDFYNFFQPDHETRRELLEKGRGKFLRGTPRETDIVSSYSLEFSPRKV